MIQVQYDRGVYLPAHDLWLDPHQPKRLAFVSHAHADHIAPHQEIILSERTARLMQARMPGERHEHVLPFGEPTVIHGLPITLYPAGHIFGSAQFYLETEAGSLLYTGDFKLRPGLSAEPTGWRQAETLIMETTFGLPRYRFPETAEVVAQIIAFCRDALAEDAVPILLGYSLGKAQEILCSLAGAGLRPMLHGSVFRMTRIYEQFGQSCGEFERYDADALEGKVLICPPSANRSRMLEKIPRKRVAMISGWAIDPNARFRYQTDAAFPLSDHADYTDLVRYVELVQPKRVLTLHGFAAEFARDLRKRGIEAWALSQENQLELTLRTGAAAKPASAPPAVATAPPADSEFALFAATGEAIAATPGKLEKVRILAEYLRSLDQEQLASAARYLTGKAFAQSDPRTLQVGWAVIFRALLAATKRSNSELRQIGSHHGDAGKMALEALEGYTAPEPCTLAESQAFFDQLQKARGPIQKAELLARQLASLSAPEGQYVVKILTGDLRIGLREGLVEEAVASAFNAAIDEVKEANMLLGDLGQTARLAARGALHEAELSLFRPIKCMLASPEPTAEAIWARFQPDAEAAADAAIFVEDKFDGIRAQLHRGADRVELFSRDLRRMTEQFPELVQAAGGLESEVILDGEIIAFEDGRRLTFFDLQKRLGRKHEGADLFATASANVPVVFVAFDLLWQDGSSLLKSPLRERRTRLRALDLAAPFQLSEVFPAHSAAEIETAFGLARRRLNEGLMVKDPESLYSPGRRGMFWFKLKKELATLDVVVVAVERGHGKRNHVLSDYTFAVRDDASGALLTIGKAYSGLTDVEIAELTEHFNQHTTNDRGRYREVTPNVVLEVAFDAIQPSTRHASGLALRFPRIKAIRRDKTVEAIDTLAYARKLAEERAGGKG